MSTTPGFLLDRVVRTGGCILEVGRELLLEDFEWLQGRVVGGAVWRRDGLPFILCVGFYIFSPGNQTYSISPLRWVHCGQDRQHTPA